MEDHAVSSHCESHAIRLRFFWPVCDHDSHICRYVPFGNLVLCDESQSFGARRHSFIAFHESSPFVFHSFDPVRCIATFDQLVVFGELFGVWVDGVSVVCKVFRVCVGAGSTRCALRGFRAI
jgi:hypothetical protein